MTRNFLEGARKERMSYTPAGLYKAWTNLDAASKVYALTVLGLIISVCYLMFTRHRRNANVRSSCPPSFSTSVHAASTPLMASSAP